MAETDPRGIVCVWRRGGEGLTAAQIFRNTFAFFPARPTGPQVSKWLRSVWSCAQRRKSDASASVQNPHHSSHAGPTGKLKLWWHSGRSFWLTRREYTSAYGRVRRRAELDVRGQVKGGLQSVCLLLYANHVTYILTSLPTCIHQPEQELPPLWPGTTIVRRPLENLWHAESLCPQKC